MNPRHLIVSSAFAFALVACMTPAFQKQDTPPPTLDGKLAWMEARAISCSLVPPVDQQTFVARYWIVSQAPDEAITGIILYKSGEEVRATILQIDKKLNPMGTEATIKSTDGDLVQMVRGSAHTLGRLHNNGGKTPSLDGTLHILNITEDRANSSYQCPDAATRDDEYAHAMASLLTRLMHAIEPKRLRPLRAKQ